MTEPRIPSDAPASPTFQNYLNRFGNKECEYRIIIPGSRGQEPIAIQTFARSFVLGLLAYPPKEQRVLVELLLKEIRAAEDGMYRFTATNGCAAMVTEQPWFNGIIIVVLSY
ncbi:MAG: hypothetical protein V1778_03650 [bacterium]